MALKADKLFDMMKPHLEKNGAEMVKKLGFIYCFEVYKKKGDKPKAWTINLKDGTGSFAEGRVKIFLGQTKIFFRLAKSMLLSLSVTMIASSYPKES
jgi:hypothetical protein